MTERLGSSMWDGAGGVKGLSSKSRIRRMARPPVNFTNQFLIAMPSLREGMFAGTVVYLCEHNENGALGLVINKPIDIKLKNLFEKVELSLDREDLADVPV